LRAPTVHVKLARQERCAALLRLALVSRMAPEEVAFCIKRLLDWFGRVDVTLVMVHNRDVAQEQRDDAARKDIDDIGTSIPKILGVKFIHGVAGGLGNVLEKHVTNLSLDILRLVANGNLR
jgi:hypothetical protein